MRKHNMPKVVWAFIAIRLGRAAVAHVQEGNGGAPAWAPGLGLGIERPELFIRFLALGDWGGSEVWPYRTRAQVDTAEGMAAVSASASGAGGGPPPSFVLALGDNFYSHGIPPAGSASAAAGGGAGGATSSSSGVSYRFRETFEVVYGRHPPLDVPWHVCAGNHDHLGNVTAQLAYHGTDPRWNFPALNHRFATTVRVPDDPGPAAASAGKFGSGGGDGQRGNATSTLTVEVLLIDTVTLAGLNPLTALRPTDAGYFDPPPGPPSPEAADRQLAWLERHLSRSSADYLFVAGHYPVLSACQHGSTQPLVDSLDPLLRKYRVTAYLSGHDHCQEHIHRRGVDYLLTGTGDECCYSASNADALPGGSELRYVLSSERNPTGARGGFASFRLGPGGAAVMFHDEGGRVLYGADLLPRRAGREYDPSLSVALN